MPNLLEPTFTTANIGDIWFVVYNIEYEEIKQKHKEIQYLRGVSIKFWIEPARMLICYLLLEDADWRRTLWINKYLNLCDSPPWFYDFIALQWNNIYSWDEKKTILWDTIKFPKILSRRQYYHSIAIRTVFKLYITIMLLTKWIEYEEI